MTLHGKAAQTIPCQTLSQGQSTTLTIDSLLVMVLIANRLMKEHTLNLS